MPAVAQTVTYGGQMNARVLIEKSRPLARIEILGNALVQFLGLQSEDLPTKVLLAGRVRLVSSSKRNKYCLAAIQGCTYQAATIAQKTEAV